MQFVRKVVSIGAVLLPLLALSPSMVSAGNYADVAKMDHNQPGQMKHTRNGQHAEMKTKDWNYRRSIGWTWKGLTGGSVNFHRKISVAPNFTLGWGDSTFSFTPSYGSSCGGFSYNQQITDQFSVNAAVSCTTDGTITVSGGANVYINIPGPSIPFGPFFVQIDGGLSAGVTLSGYTKIKGEWGVVKYPIYRHGIRRPDAFGFSVSPSIAGLITAKVGIGVPTAANLHAYARVTVLNINPTAGIEIGYKWVNRARTKYRHYRKLTGNVKFSGGGGAAGVGGQLAGLTYEVQLFTWEDIFSHTVTYLDDMYKSPVLM
ncbi:hypothetical protein CS022_23160 [Veronia nyctiphanis]|uniref:Uncharacterized protein n=1 Tax=Veronia nyctiphanis TaxID=1278244 RepID=A0A4Q0YMN0_9GAMM|nr:hypothetical protein [Veronia nyctiphanis]RXJ70441.1 hypothetical protein CS022_23160 [Veronia nyctiphanis]